MKKYFNLCLMLLISGLIGCSSSDNSEGVPTDEPDNNGGNAMDLTYTSDIRAIIQANCLSCHGNPPTNNAPMSLTTYALVKSAVENRGLVNRINSSVNPMPPNGRMPLATRQMISDWVNQGLPE
ncbi:cytochrome c [uncultured Muriicola sp.]|uniref:c-type cytochrome n=1 Tax=uncultured Muriicola sp. TaxID=1583102 RepID=UPI002624C404|nr:cytochrome c [uncultured Muriicola sp.]